MLQIEIDETSIWEPYYNRSNNGQSVAVLLRLGSSIAYNDSINRDLAVAQISSNYIAKPIAVTIEIL